MTNIRFLFCALIVAALVAFAARMFGSEYFYYAGYVVLQYVVLATAWNILGGNAGYVNFGTAAFFAIGAYTTAAIYNSIELPIPIFIFIGGVVCGLLGLGMGYLTLRLSGVYFSIATLALSMVAQTFVINWEYVGGSRGTYVLVSDEYPLFGGLVPFLFINMLLVAVVAVTVARSIGRSDFGYGLAAIKDDEQAAEAAGVPTLRLKLIATALSGAFMGMAGSLLPFYVAYLEPTSTFSLAYTVNSVAMPIVGGMSSWLGPVIGALLLGTIQQVATVTVSSEANLLIVGGVLVFFVIMAPTGIVGLVKNRLPKRGDQGSFRRSAFEEQILDDKKADRK